MAKLLIVILDDLKHMPKILHAWNEIGVPGTTILDSAGAFRATSWLSRVGMGALERLSEAREVRRRTLMTAIDDDELLEKAIAEAELAIGGFDRPNSGLLLVLPIETAKGMTKMVPSAQPEPLPRAFRPAWKILRDTPVKEVADLLDLKPTLVAPGASLDEVAQAMCGQCNVHVACVVSDEGRLLGLLKLSALADDLFFHIMPEEFLSESTDLEHVMSFASLSRMRTAADAMQAPVWVKENEKIKDAFKRMHDNGLSGLPVVDDQYHVIGYVNLLELLTFCMGQKDKRDTTGEAP